MEDFDLVLNDSFVIRFTLIPMSRNTHTQVRVFTVTNMYHISSITIVLGRGRQLQN